jgi:hypothetical protein
MSDFNSSLPVRTETNGDVVTKICDATTNTQELTVNADGSIDTRTYDGSGNAITSNVVGPKTGLDVYLLNSAAGVDVAPASQTILTQDIGSSSTTGANSQVIVTGSPTATSTASFAYSSYETIVIQVTGTWTGTLTAELSQDGGTTWYPTYAYQQGTEAVFSSWTANFLAGVNVSGTTNFRLRATAVMTGSAVVNIIESGNVNSVYVQNDVGVTQVGAPWTINLTEIGGSAYSEGQKTMANSAPVVIASDQSPVAENITEILGAAPSASNSLPVQITTGTAYVSETNPLPVELATAGTPVNDYKDATAIAASASDNHDYTVTALKTLHLTQLESASSGKAKMQVEIETGVATNVFTTHWVQFNSTANTNMSIHLAEHILVAAGVRVRLVMTNLDKQAEDIYSTISGHEE